MNHKYSDWLKIDLHIHTDFSKKTKSSDYKGSFSVDTLYAKLSEQNVKIFSLTDHNIINLPAYKAYYDKYNNETDPLLLVGVELDVEGPTKKYHTLLIFNYSDYNGAKEINDLLEQEYSKNAQDYFERKLSFDSIISIFGDKDFFFIPHAGNTSSIIGGYRDHIDAAQKMIILMQSPLEKVKEKNRQIYNHGFNQILEEAFRNKDDFAYLEFSDNHYIENYPCRHMGDHGLHNFYYVKGSKNYETLRLAFIDPKSRIMSSSQYSELDFQRDYIKSLECKNGSVISKTKLAFSPYLNVIIGGRSSGKSLILDILNRSIDTLSYNPKYDKIVSDIEISISSKLDAQSHPNTHVNADIIQINQGDIVNYFENHKLNDLANKSGKHEVYSAAKRVFLDKKEDLVKLLQNLQDSYNNAFTSQINKSFILHDNTIQHLLNSEYLLTLDTRDIKLNIIKPTEFESAIEAIDTINSKIEILKNLHHINFSNEDDLIIETFQETLRKKRKEQLKTQSLHQYMKEFIDLAENDISTANRKLNDEGQAKATAHSTHQILLNQISQQFESLCELFLAANELEAFPFNHKESIYLDEDSKLCLETTTQKQIKDYIIEGIKDCTTDNLYLSILGLLYNDLKLKNYTDTIPENFKKKTNSQTSTHTDLYDAPIDYLEYSDGTTSKNNSPGYNSEKYLKVILNNSTSGLVIIDQPEDNLGNKFISEELVDLIRDIKFKKQLFLVTHNPAIVVYGDAESIIIAENQENTISYRQVKLENPESQKEICETLDGGEYIFDNRSRKYNIQRLLKGE